MGDIDVEAISVKSRFMRGGDRIVVEPGDGQDFVAEVVMCLGWGLVHGVMNWKMRRDDGEEFVYGIHIDTPVRRVPA